MLVKSAAVLAGLAFVTGASAEGDPARGERLADTCKGCHAVETYNNVYPTYHVPKLAGQKEAYIVSALQLYRDGQRSHETMVAQAASLSDQDIADIAAYMAGAGNISENPQAKGTPPEAAQVCAACHGQAGVSAIPTNPNLAGQHLDYLEQALEQYKSGARKGPNAIAMQAQLMAISPEHLAAVVAFYAAQDGVDNL
jgi:cytochrome c553